MIINTDSIYVKGYNHGVCEDYALDGSVMSPLDDVHYAIVCDGCSGSHGYVDVGARLLAHGIVKFLRNMGTNVHYYYDDCVGFYDNLCYHMKRTIHNASESVGLSKFSFISTIQAIILIKDKIFYFRYGDGSLITYYNKDICRRWYVDFPSNTPYYFVDSFEGRDMQRYCDMFNNHKIMKDGAEYSVDDYVYNWTSFWQVIDIGLSKGEETVFAVTTDGIETFYKFDDVGNNVGLELDSVLNQAFDFKNFQGQFIKRRFKKFFKDMDKQECKHYDDISVAGIYIKGE